MGYDIKVQEIVMIIVKTYEYGYFEVYNLNPVGPYFGDLFHTFDYISGDTFQAGGRVRFYRPNLWFLALC